MHEQLSRTCSTCKLILACTQPTSLCDTPQRSLGPTYTTSITLDLCMTQRSRVIYVKNRDFSHCSWDEGEISCFLCFGIWTVLVTRDFGGNGYIRKADLLTSGAGYQMMGWVWSSDDAVPLVRGCVGVLVWVVVDVGLIYDLLWFAMTRWQRLERRIPLQILLRTVGSIRLISAVNFKSAVSLSAEPISRPDDRQGCRSSSKSLHLLATHKVRNLRKIENQIIESQSATDRKPPFLAKFSSRHKPATKVSQITSKPRTRNLATTKQQERLRNWAGGIVRKRRKCYMQAKWWLMCRTWGLSNWEARRNTCDMGVTLEAKRGTGWDACAWDACKHFAEGEVVACDCGRHARRLPECVGLVW